MHVRMLSEIAEDSGLTMADVAFLADLQESTISRMWEKQDWLDKISGRSLRALIGALPGVAEYIYAYSLQSRRKRLIEGLSAQGVEVNLSVLRHLVLGRGVPEQYLSNALESVGHILRGDLRMSAAHLVRFWDRERDSVLGILFEADSTRNPLGDINRFVDASISVANGLSRKGNSFYALLGQATVIHHVA